MDGREAMPSFYLHRVIGAPPGFQHVHNPNPNPNPNPSPNSNPNIHAHSPGLGGGPIVPAFQVEPSSSGGGVNVGGLLGGIGLGEPVKRKRGRPRKYGPGAMSLALSTTPPSASAPGMGFGSAASSGSGPKRGRGRPPGTGRKQQLASLGEWVSGSAGMGFTPHVVIIPIGEDIAAKIMSFSQQGPRAVCILSANGTVSTATLRQPTSSGGTVTYEGRFEILCLSGSYLLTDDGGARSRTGGLSISLSSPDGRVIGGGVGGLLIAASPVQVIVGSFTYAGTKSKSKVNAVQESGVMPEAPAEDTQSMPTGMLPRLSSSTSQLMGGWPVSRQMDTGSPSIGIDLMQG